MHDPMVVAFEIYTPLGYLRNWRRERALRRGDTETYQQIGYPGPLVTVWHVDPETDGSDDSCGYSFVRIPKDVREKIEKEARSEREFMFGKYPTLAPASVYEIIFAVWSIIAWRFFRQRRLSALDLELIGSLASNPSDNLRSTVNAARVDEDEYERMWMLIYRSYATYHRPWYRRPKWHVHHWKLQFPFTQKLKRFLFSRCAGCGKGFSWGYAPVTSQWHSEGPRWFKSEQGKYHHNCMQKRRAA